MYYEEIIHTGYLRGYPVRKEDIDKHLPDACLSCGADNNRCRKCATIINSYDCSGKLIQSQKIGLTLN